MSLPDGLQASVDEEGVPREIEGDGEEEMEDTGNAILPVAPMPRIEYFYVPRPDSEVKAAIESVFPRIVRVCVKELGMSFNGYIPLRIHVVYDSAEFQAIEKRLFPTHRGIQGFYAPTLDSIVIRGDHTRLDIVSTLYHEATHALMQREFTRTPVWINEGLAEFFEGFRVHGSSTMVFDPDHHDPWSKHLLLRGEMIPLDRYLHLSDKEWRSIETSGQVTSLSRIMAWSLITFLMSHDEGIHAFSRYLQVIKQGQMNTRLAEGYAELEATYPGGIRSLERKWHRWIREQHKPLKY